MNKLPAFYIWCIMSFSSFISASLFSEESDSLDHAVISIYAINDKGDVLIDKNSHLSLMPASCMKIVTTGAALHLLGPDSTFETTLEYDGTIDQKKTLHGNLYIRGGGDPCLGSERMEEAYSWDRQIEIWKDEIKKIGIQKIMGKVIGDDTKWEKARAVPSWTWEDIGNYYGAGACALSFHENYYSLFFKPGEKEGDNTAILYTDPPLPTSTFHNEVRTGPEGSGDCAYIFGSEFSPLQFVRGTIPAGVDKFTIKGSLSDPAAYCADLLAKRLQENGIAIKQQDLPRQERKTVFHTAFSPAVEKIIYWTNQKSINLYAEHLLKKMGETVYHDGSTASGIKAVTDFWRSQGIDLNGFYMADGSGLSRKNLITTKQLVQMLSFLKKSKFFPVFFKSLPQKEGFIRAKSGSISFVRGQAGYAEDITFAIIINQCSNIQAMNDKICSFFSDLHKINEKQISSAE